MRNSGWYIPYWRKPKKKSKSNRASAEEVTRSEEQLEAVRRRWVERYRRTLRALRVLGLSMGSTRGEVQTRYEALRASGAMSDRELEDAYRHLLHVLPPVERRKRRPRTGAETGADQSGEGVTQDAAEGLSVDAENDDEEGLSVDAENDDEEGLSVDAENDDEEDDGSPDDLDDSYDEVDEEGRSPNDAGGETV